MRQGQVDGKARQGKGGDLGRDVGGTSLGPTMGLLFNYFLRASGRAFGALSGLAGTYLGAKRRDAGVRTETDQQKDAASVLGVTRDGVGPNASRDLPTVGEVECGRPFDWPYVVVVPSALWLALEADRRRFGQYHCHDVDGRCSVLEWDPDR